ncbi:unnamed protein product [Rotaria sp. Silwood2]|nr:unnamed protein product [Rotaria sp. Silwood2]CAF2463145.1 unnamed protein product [Rotaria sp. Silwood2]CAF2699250.1 unnamed protein product [Rotaria sp. Silwood2]CAF2853085.1 unnamed protein product [Rotaria sp. Silwood2]CAF3916637.1 unnamed protein product [Rotaria sp. Silwood2]
MLLLIVFISALIYSTDSLKIALPTTIIQSQTPAGISIGRTSTNDEGQFIIADGNSDHLFRSYDFIKEDIVKFNEGDTENTKNDVKIRCSCNTINPCLPSIQIIEGHFVHYDNDSDEHLFDEEDFQKTEV